MRRTRPAHLVAAVALLALAAAPTHAQQQEAEAITDLLRDDLTALGVNVPVWLSQHLPAVMPATGIGAGSGLSDDSGGVSFGVMTRIGLLNNFNDVGYGLQLVDLAETLPSLVPWPQLGVVVGIGLGDGLEIGADVQFIPNLDVAADDVNLRVGLIAVGATLRWRVNKADGALPSFVVGLGASIYHGSFGLGVGYERGYSETVDGRTVTGTYRFESAPTVDWTLFQANPELRLAWDIGGVFRPYLGLGLGLAGGSVSNAIRVKARLTVDTIDGQPTNEEPFTYDEDVVDFTTEPALFTLRPHVGFDLVLGVFALTVQADFAVMGKDELNSDFSGAAGDFDLTDENFLFNRNAEGRQENAALVLTVAARAQF